MAMRLELSSRAFAVWRRNFLVWKKLALPSILGNLADPMIYLFGLGYGLGGLLPQVEGTSYIAFLAAGTVCASTMNAASFEALYSAFSRMHVQRTWEAIMNAPVTLEDVMAGELLWAAAKATLSGIVFNISSTNMDFKGNEFDLLNVANPGQEISCTQPSSSTSSGSFRCW